MQIEQRFELPFPPDAAWPAFRDIALLVECLPGASLTGEPAGGEVPLRFDVKLGPIAAGFAGSGKATFDDAARSGRFEGSAADRKTNSRVKGAADFVMTPSGTGSSVSVNVDYALTGSLAQFGRAGIVREIANALTAQFAANLGARLIADSAVAPETPTVQTSEPPPLSTATTHPHPVDASMATAEATPIPAAPASEASATVVTATGPRATATAPVGASTSASATAPATAPTAKPAARAPAAVVPLSAGSLLMHILRERLSHLAHRLGFRRSP